MPLNWDVLIENFWLGFYKANRPSHYVRLLIHMEELVLEYFLISNKTVDKYIDSAPFLAMVSEIDYVSPESVEFVSMKSEIVNYSKNKIRSYSEETRKELKASFLKENN